MCDQSDSDEHSTNSISLIECLVFPQFRGHSIILKQTLLFKYNNTLY